MLLLSEAFFVFVDQLGCIIEVFYFILFILFLDIASPTNKIFYSHVFTSLIVCLLSKKSILKDLSLLVSYSTNTEES